MPLRNPYRPDGEFTTVDKLAVLRAEVDRMKPALQRLVDQKRMRPSNFAAKVGALEALVSDLEDQQVQRIPPDLQDKAPAIIYLKDEAHRQQFLKWAASQGLPTRPI